MCFSIGLTSGNNNSQTAQQLLNGIETVLGRSGTGPSAAGGVGAGRAKKNVLIYSEYLLYKNIIFVQSFIELVLDMIV